MSHESLAASRLDQPIAALKRNTPAMDALILEARATLDPDAHRALYQEIG